jgi:hypothetical protein
MIVGAWVQQVQQHQHNNVKIASFVVIIVGIMLLQRRSFFLTPLHPSTWRNLASSHYDDVTSNSPPHYTLIVVIAWPRPSPWRSPVRLFLLCCHYCPAATVALHAPPFKESATTIPAFASPSTTICHLMLFVIFGGGHRQQQEIHHTPLNKICCSLLLPLFSKHSSTRAACLSCVFAVVIIDDTPSSCCHCFCCQQ